MNHSALEFFKIVKQMIHSGATCSEILKKINKQPNEIKSLFPKIYLRTLKLGRDQVLKDQFNQGKIGGITSLGEAVKTGAPFKLNDYDRFEIFIEECIKNLEKKNQEKKSKSV